MAQKHISAGGKLESVEATELNGSMEMKIAFVEDGLNYEADHHVDDDISTTLSEEEHSSISLDI